MCPCVLVIYKEKNVNFDKKGLSENHFNMKFIIYFVVNMVKNVYLCLVFCYCLNENRNMQLKLSKNAYFYGQTYVRYLKTTNMRFILMNVEGFNYNVCQHVSNKITFS